MKKKWKVRVPKGRMTVAQKVRSAKVAGAIRTALAAAAISTAYFGVIALLMMPAFDIA